MNGSPDMSRSDMEISLAAGIQEADLRTASLFPAEGLFLRPGEVPGSQAYVDITGTGYERPQHQENESERGSCVV